MSFKGDLSSIVADDALYVLPWTAVLAAFSDLGSGASDTIAFPVLPANTVPVDAFFGVDAAWTSGSGNTTGLTLAIGDGDPDNLLNETDLIGVSADTWIGAAATDANIRNASEVQVSGYSGLLTFVPVGAGSEDLDDIDAGSGIGFLRYTGLPDMDQLIAFLS